MVKIKCYLLCVVQRSRQTHEMSSFAYPGLLIKAPFPSVSRGKLKISVSMISFSLLCRPRGRTSCLRWRWRTLRTSSARPPWRIIRRYAAWRNECTKFRRSPTGCPGDLIRNSEMSLGRPETGRRHRRHHKQVHIWRLQLTVLHRPWRRSILIAGATQTRCASRFLLWSALYLGYLYLK